jgi:hypothetical protein
MRGYFMTFRSRNAVLPALLVTLGLGMGLSGTLATPLLAQEKVEFQAKKLNAAQLLKKQRQAVAYVLKAYKALPKEQRGKSAPFLKSLAETAKQIKAIDRAADAKDSKSLAVALPKLAEAIAQANLTYQLSGLKDKKIGGGLKTLNQAWEHYLKRIKGSNAKNAKDQAQKNGRRIKDMERRLDKMAQGQLTDKEKKELERLRKLLAKASNANKKADQQWYTTILIADFTGYYSGYYYWYTAYDTSSAAFWQSEWEYFETSSSYFYAEYSEYYESYSWTSYEESVEVSESYDFEYTAEEYASFESEYESTEESLDASAEEEYQATDEDDEIQAAESYDDPDETADDPADEPDQEADADSTLEDDAAAADNDTQNDDDYLDTAADDSGDDDADASADDASDDSAASDDGNDADDNSSDDNASDDNGMDDSSDDGAADDSGADDDGGADDSGGGDDDG